MINFNYSKYITRNENALRHCIKALRYNDKTCCVICKIFYESRFSQKMWNWFCRFLIFVVGKDDLQSLHFSLGFQYHLLWTFSLNLGDIDFIRLIAATWKYPTSFLFGWVKSALTPCVWNGRIFRPFQIHFTVLDTVLMIINLCTYFYAQASTQILWQQEAAPNLL